MEKKRTLKNIETVVFENAEEYTTSSHQESIKNANTLFKLLNTIDEKKNKKNKNSSNDFLPKVLSRFKEKQENNNNSGSAANLMLIDKKRLSNINVKLLSKRLSTSDAFKPTSNFRFSNVGNNFPVLKTFKKQFSDNSVKFTFKDDINKIANRRASRYPSISPVSDVNQLFSTQVSNESDGVNFSSLIKYRRLQTKGGNLMKTKYFNKKKQKFFKNLVKNDQDLNRKKKQFEIIKKYAYVLIISSILCIILSLIDCEIYNYNSYSYIIDNKIPKNEYYKIKNRKITNSENWVRYLNIIFCVSSFITTIRIYTTKLYFMDEEENEIKNKLKKKNNNNTTYPISKIQNKIHSNTSLFKLIIRSIINIIFYPPYLNYVFRSSFDKIIYITPLNTVFLFLNTFKLYNVYRCTFYFLPITSALGKVQCNKYNVRLNVKYMFRALNAKYPIFFPLIIVGIIFFLFSFLIHNTEKFTVDLSNNIDNINKTEYTSGINSNEFRRLGSIIDTLWINASSLISVIFDDYYLLSPVTKILMVLSKLFGTLFIYMIYYRLNMIVLLDSRDSKAYSKLEKLFKPENKENKARDVILALLLLKKVNKEHKKQIEFFHRSEIFNNSEDLKLIEPINYEHQNIKYLKTKFVFFSKFFTDIANFADLHKVSRNLPLPINTMFQNMEDTMDDNLDSLNVKLDSLASIDATLGSIKQNSIILEKKIGRVIKHNFFVLNYLREVFNEKNTEMAKHKIIEKARIHKSSKNIMNQRKSSCHIKDKRTKTANLSNFSKLKKLSIPHK